VTCRELADFIDDYLSGVLAPDIRRRFQLHLLRCANCRKYLAGYEATVALGRRAFDDELAPTPSDVPADLVASILAARR
jgi:anti-sigma factor RsiW